MQPISDIVVPVFSWLYLYLGIAIVAIAVICFLFNKKHIAICLVLFGGFLLRLYLIGLDPFLHYWDERYHALVAKNIMSNWLMPTLYKKPILPYDYTYWAANYIWLHKQPFFLWQMALSMKVFGVNEIALRLPSALLSTFAIWVVYRIGKLVYNEQTGFIAAIFFALNNYVLEFVCGYFGSDHNDLAFMCYVLFSFWAWIEYTYSKKSCWLMVIGLFAGIAVLVKWLIGLLVYAGWGAAIIILSKNKLIEIKNLAFSLAISCIVFIPWQAYIFVRWHKEAIYEYQYNVSHFAHVVEGHDGDWTYYFSYLPEMIGVIQLFFLIPGIILLLVKKDNFKVKFGIIFSILIIILFFTIAQTKMHGFILPIIPLLLIISASSFDWLITGGISKLKIRHLLIVLSFILIMGPAYLNLSPAKIIERRDYNGIACHGSPDHNDNYFNAQLYRQLPNLLHKKNYVIVMAKPQDEVSCMFYTGYTTYGFISKEDYKLLKKQNLPIASFPNNIPGFLKNDTSVFKIPLAWR